MAVAADSALVELPAVVVTASRAPQDASRVALRVDRFEAGELTGVPAFTLDEALRASAAFSLFRRSSSLTAHPTAQGVSLRGIGPSGASRSLVLFDGVPLNDPFGGWVAWSKVPRLTVRSAEILRGGGSGAWGSAALGGVVQIFEDTAAPRTGALALEGGDFRTWRAEAIAVMPAGEGGALRIGGRWFTTDGSFQYARSQRGAIDRPLDSRHALGHAEYALALASGLRLSVAGSLFDEERGNGTPFARNQSREQSGRARLAGEIRPGLLLDASVYAQGQTFASGFSSVVTGRAVETPSLDQFDVPATAWGGAAVVTAAHANDAATTIGVDLRHVQGETREAFFYSGGRFTRHRFAGGSQTTGGAFISHRRELGSQWSAQLGARVDGWQVADGHRREQIIDTGVRTRDERFADRDGVEFSPSFGLVWKASEEFRVRGAVYQAFRVPTLNEFFRPFRVGNVSTEANPELANESLAGADLGVELQRGPWTLTLGGFATRMHDAVANVTLNTTPALVSRQRRNLDRVQVHGLEAGLNWRWDERLAVFLNYQLTDARVDTAAIAPTLEGRRLPQVPRQAAVLGITWRPASAWRVNGGIRSVSGQFEDDDNQLRLDAATTADLGATWTFSPGREVYLAVENLFDARVETARSADGLVALGTPRHARAGFTARW